MNEQLTIAKETEDDVPAVQDVLYKTWLATYPNAELGITTEDIEDRYKNRHSPKTLEKRRSAVRNPSPGDTMLVAKLDGKVVGACRAIERDNVNQVQAIYVLPEYHGRGIGTALMNETNRYFSPVKDTIVEVVTYNKSAIAFYEKHGFIDTGIRLKDERFKLKSGAMMPEMRMIRKALRSSP